jgi:hypothetical protein
MTTNKSADVYFSSITIIIIITKFIELTLLVFAYDSYLMSAFFFIDLLNLTSLFLDVHYISDSFYDYLKETTDEDQLANIRYITTVRIARVIRITHSIISLSYGVKLIKFSRNSLSTGQGKVNI